MRLLFYCYYCVAQILTDQVNALYNFIKVKHCRSIYTEKVARSPYNSYFDGLNKLDVFTVMRSIIALNWTQN